ncbi:MAG: hypothetical protein B6244_14665 [Candidatus Cloacimonetes bacterium 4572_55]|nr:MAG: hypothetical protein B6244_14665 [Candidatus Cloacimonetes bacterium 4572_55]
MRFFNKSNLIWQSFVISLLIILLLSTGCQKKVTEVTECDPSWTPHDFFISSTKILRNGYVSKDNKFFVSTLHSVYKLEPGDGNPTFCFESGHDTFTFQYKPPLSDSLAAHSWDHDRAVIIRRLEGLGFTGGHYTGRYINLTDIDSTFTDKARIAVWGMMDPIGAFNDQNQFLTLVHQPAGTGVGELYFCRIDYRLTEQPDLYPSTGIEITSTQAFRPPLNLSVMRTINDCIAYQNRFFVGIGSGGSYLVEQTGEFRRLDFPHSAAQFFSHQDTLYALNDALRLYRSLDVGDTWQKLARFSNTLRFYYIQGRLCANTLFQLWEIDLVNLVINEIDNDGLSGNKILSVHEFDNRVYVLTLTGLFYRDMDDFFTYKPDDTEEKGMVNPGLYLQGLSD